MRVSHAFVTWGEGGGHSEKFVHVWSMLTIHNSYTDCSHAHILSRDPCLWIGILGISVENCDCRLLRPTYGTHGGSPPPADMFGITTQNNWSKMRSSYTIVNVLNVRDPIRGTSI